MGNIISGIMRKAVKDVEIRGHLIPKGWCVFTYFRSVHLDEKHYEEAYKFNPWRWKVSEGVCHACVAGDRSIAHLPLSFAKQGEGVSRVHVHNMSAHTGADASTTAAHTCAGVTVCIASSRMIESDWSLLCVCVCARARARERDHRWVAEEDHIVNFPTVRMKGGMPIRVRRRRRS
ncbi:hypothetical protein GW17_00051375 [Ensete ventricosum]|nr:hypothetical protein GW17_00051375 [Ensete ventricosum]RZR79541.1 hypothetical protein BHM03_00005283 [Ensete ventricosum]